MEKNNQTVSGGGACFHAPSAVAMGKDAFIAQFLPVMTSNLGDERKALKFLTDKYNDCVALLNPPKHSTKAPADVEVPEPIKEIDEPVKKTGTNRKHESKKE